jgi:hypothetical protein
MEEIIIPQTIGKRLIKKISSQPPVSTVLHSTALSRKEAIATLLIYDLGYLSNVPYGYVGNIGIKSFILSEFKPYVNASYDLDVAVKNINQLGKLERRKENMLDGIKRKQEGLSCKYEIVFSPFEVYRVPFPSFQIGYDEYRELDPFDIETGIGPVPLHPEDFERCKTIEYLRSLPLEIQLATHLNPLAYTSERGKRAFLATVSASSIDHDAIRQRLEESGDKVKRVGIPLSQYKDGFRKVERGCREIEKKFRKNRKVIEESYLENWKILCKLVGNLYETLPVV